MEGYKVGNGYLRSKVAGLRLGKQRAGKGVSAGEGSDYELS